MRVHDHLGAAPALVGGGGVGACEEGLDPGLYYCGERGSSIVVAALLTLESIAESARPDLVVLAHVGVIYDEGAFVRLGPEDLVEWDGEFGAHVADGNAADFVTVLLRLCFIWKGYQDNMSAHALLIGRRNREGSPVRDYAGTFLPLTTRLSPSKVSEALPSFTVPSVDGAWFRGRSVSEESMVNRLDWIGLDE